MATKLQKTDKDDKKAVIKRHFYSMRVLAKADMSKDGDSAEIMLYEQIGKDYWSDEGIGAKDFADDLKSLGDVKNINLRIHSPGGSVFEGLAIYNNLKMHPAKKTVSIDGVAASMAAYIAMVGDTITMPENAMMMVHGPQAMVMGNAQDMRDMADTLDKCSESLMSILKTRCNAADDVIQEMLSKDTWLTAQDCKEMGMCDTVTNEVKMAASLDLSKFKNIPQALLEAMTASAAASGKASSGGLSATPTGAVSSSPDKDTQPGKCLVCSSSLIEGECRPCAKAEQEAVRKYNAERTYQHYIKNRKE